MFHSQDNFKTKVKEKRYVTFLPRGKFSITYFLLCVKRWKLTSIINFNLVFKYKSLY